MSEAGQRVRTLVVWEPVIMTDFGAPSTAALARIPGAGVAQFWDPGLTVSRAIVEHLLAHREAVPTGAEIRPDTIVWDAVVLFGAEARWDAGFPEPAFQAFPVVSDEEGLARAVREAVSRSEQPARPAPEGHAVRSDGTAGSG